MYMYFCTLLDTSFNIYRGYVHISINTSAVTAFMIRNIRIFAKIKNIVVEWEQPHILPKEYSIVYACGQVGESEFSIRQCRTVPPEQTRTVIGKIPPGSTCTVTFTANYGQARNDSGKTQTVIVPYRSEDKIIMYRRVCVCLSVCLSVCLTDWLSVCVSGVGGNAKVGGVGGAKSCPSNILGIIFIYYTNMTPKMLLYSTWSNKKWGWANAPPGLGSI